MEAALWLIGIALSASAMAQVVQALLSWRETRSIASERRRLAAFQEKALEAERNKQELWKQDQQTQNRHARAHEALAASTGAKLQPDLGVAAEVHELGPREDPDADSEDGSDGSRELGDS